MIASPERRTQRAAFSLLELLIVLVVMVGLLAVAWPSLRRPLADSVLQQAGHEIRRAFEDARQAALATGRPVLLRLHAESGTLELQTMEEVIGRDRNESPSLSSANERSTSDRNPFHDRFPDPPPLSAGVVIEQVLTGDALRDKSDRQEMDGDRFAEEMGESRQRGELTNTWLLPILPSGRSIDFRIVLRDTSNRRRLGVQRDSAVGSLQFVPMPYRRSDRDQR